LGTQIFSLSLARVMLNNSSFMLGYLSEDIIYSKKHAVFWEHSTRKTVSFKEQIMSKDKNPSVFSCQMETNVFHILQIFFTTHVVLKIEEYRLDTPQFFMKFIIQERWWKKFRYLES